MNTIHEVQEAATHSDDRRMKVVAFSNPTDENWIKDFWTKGPDERREYLQGEWPDA